MSDSRRRIILIVVLVAIVAPVFGLAMYGMFMGFERPVRSGDRALVVTAEDLALEGVDIDATKVSLVRRWYPDGSWSVEYEYDGDDLFVSSSVDHEVTASNARTVYVSYHQAVNIGGLIEDGLGESKPNDLYNGGDASRSTLMTVGGETSGNYVVVRKGNSVLTFMVSGFFFDEAGMLDEILDPKVAGLPD